MMLLLAQRFAIANASLRQSHHALDDTESARRKRFPVKASDGGLEVPGAIRSSRSEGNRARKKRARASARIEGVPSPSSRTGQSLILPAIVVVVVLLSATPRSAFGQTDEIQVYDASHADPGVFNLTWHNNF